MRKPKKCPRCDSNHIVKGGMSVTVSRGKEQRFKCQECGYLFIPIVVKKGLATSLINTQINKNSNPNLRVKQKEQ